jgi:putative flavoprotein involved in K+ transport
MPFPEPPDTYPTKEQVAGYLNAYAAEFDLPVMVNSRVTALIRTAEGFEARTDDGAFRARQVVVATGPFQAPHVPPTAQRLAGKDLFWWLTRLGLMLVTAGSGLGRRLRARPDFIIGSSRRRLRAAGVRFRPAVADAEGRTVRFADGSSLDAGIVIWTTGYRPDYSWIHIPGVAGDGHLIHRRGVTDVPGLYFLGLPWQHRRGSALLGFVHEDAAYLAGRVTSRAPARQPAVRLPLSACLVMRSRRRWLHLLLR